MLKKFYSPDSTQESKVDSTSISKDQSIVFDMIQ